MDFNDHIPSFDGEVSAPDSLIIGLKQRLKNYTEYTKENVQDGVLDDRCWEVRCALLEQADVPFYQVQKALDDENTFVRMAAVRALGRSQQNIPTITSLLQKMLQDDAWLVRETTLLTMGIANISVSSSRGESYLHDPSREVRETAMWLQHLAEVRQSIPLEQQAQLPSLLSMKEIFPMRTEHISQDSQETSMPKSVSTKASRSPSTRHKQMWSIRIGLLAATMVLFLALLTAAGFSQGWWNTLFGNPDMYQQIGIQQSNHGVTLRLTRAYADEGHTVIAYDVIMSDKTKTGIVGTYDLSGSFSQKQGPLQETQCSAPQDGIQHCYLLYPAFNVSAQSNHLNLTWKVTHILVSQPGSPSSPSSIAGNWDFKFSLPFHQTNNHQLPDPITGEKIKG